MSFRALITGITGFAGGFLAEHLLEAGDAVLGLSPGGAWEPASSEAIRDDVELLAWDLQSPRGSPAGTRRSIDRFRPNVFYHLAGLSVPSDCGTDRPTPRAVAVNVAGTRRVLELAEALGPGVRVVFASSSHVYAAVSSEAPRVDEDGRVEPTGGYGWTKLEAEKEVSRFVAERGGEAVVARAFQHTGPRQNPRLMLSQWARQFALGDGGPVEVRTLGAVIDLSDVRDIVRAYRLLARKGRRGATYNVGSGIARRSGQVLEILRDLAGRERPIRQISPGFKQDPIADVNRLLRDTGWRAAVPLEQTVADTFAWWRRQAQSSV